MTGTETDMSLEEPILEGRMKWFDVSKGFGFIVCDDTEDDVLLHVNVLRNFGQSSIADGAGVRFYAQRTARGVQVVEIIEVIPPESPQNQILSDLEGIEPEQIRALPYEPARVKWFDRAKGFGFANTFGNIQDVFIHAEVLRSSSLAELTPGEAIAMRIIDGQRGRMATEVAPWDAAVTKNQPR